MSDDYGGRPSPYPGWMPESQGRSYEKQVAEQFVSAMSALAATVCIVAAASPSGERSGITATAICSLSTEPPQLLACVNRSSSIARALSDTGWFSVNIVAATQEQVAAAFAGRTGLAGDQRFDDDLWSTHTTGAPVLRGATATCVCHVSTSLQQATHLIVVGAVLDVVLPETDPPPPLMYHLRRFTAVQPSPAAPAVQPSPAPPAVEPSPAPPAVEPSPPPPDRTQP
jgi:flavin reductase (DIM6/NTAB) family NADH-FMN oxidoreductase RutF